MSAALLEKVRRHDITPALSEKERIQRYGTQDIPTLRANRQPQQTGTRAGSRNNLAATPKTVRIADVQDDEIDEREIGDLNADDDTREERPTRQQPIPIRRDLPRYAGGRRYEQHPARSPWMILALGAAGLVALYTVLFLIVLGWISLTNTFLYGPTHTHYTKATISGQPTEIQTSNIHGTIYVTLLNLKDGTCKTYTGPQLESGAWNNDMDSIVATAQAAPGQQNPKITIHVLGTINYLHLFFARPETNFYLVSKGKQGYTVVS